MPKPSRRTKLWPEKPSTCSPSPAAAAAIAAGVYKDYKDAAKHMVRVSSRVYPNPDRIDIYNKKFERYMAVSDALDTVWEKFEV